MSTHLKKDMVCEALTMALFRRKFPKLSCILIVAVNIVLMNSESFFHTLKVEFTQTQVFRDRDEAKQKIFSYIEGYYNLKRVHSAIDYKTPYEMECA
jgi:uncharacterized protein YwbE